MHQKDHSLIYLKVTVMVLLSLFMFDPKRIEFFQWSYMRIFQLYL